MCKFIYKLNLDILVKKIIYYKKNTKYIFVSKISRSIKISMRDKTTNLVDFLEKIIYKSIYKLTHCGLVKLDYSLHIADCYIHLGCYTHDLSATILSSLLKVSFIVCSTLPVISNLTLYLNHKGRLFSFCCPCLIVWGISYQSHFCVFHHYWDWDPGLNFTWTHDCKG